MVGISSARNIVPPAPRQRSVSESRWERNGYVNGFIRSRQTVGVNDCPREILYRDKMLCFNIFGYTIYCVSKNIKAQHFISIQNFSGTVVDSNGLSASDKTIYIAVTLPPTLADGALTRGRGNDIPCRRNADQKEPSRSV